VLGSGAFFPAYAAGDTLHAFTSRASTAPAHARPRRCMRVGVACALHVHPCATTSMGVYGRRVFRELAYLSAYQSKTGTGGLANSKVHADVCITSYCPSKQSVRDFVGTAPVSCRLHPAVNRPDFFSRSDRCDIQSPWPWPFRISTAAMGANREESALEVWCRCGTPFR